MTHLTDDDLTLLYYGELSDADARASRAHMDACALCRAEHARLRQLFAVVDASEVPEPAAGFEGEVWRRLQPAIRAAREPQSTRVLDRIHEWLVPSRGIALGATVAALVLVAFIVGRYWQAGHIASVPSQTTRSASQDNLRERVLLSALGDHFDRSQAMLVELASTTPTGTIDISGEQRRAHDLLAATRIYRRAAAEAGDRTVGDVLEALERVLVEVDVSPSQLSAYELRSLQNRIDEQELLFKMRVASAGVREREQSTRPAAVRSSAGA
jgi:hypothetical protein